PAGRLSSFISGVTLCNGCCAVLLILLFTFTAQAKKPHIMALTPPSPAQTALLERAIAKEKLMEKELQKRIPMVQHYIQNVKPDAKLATVPVSDEYILSRVDFDKSFEADGYREKSKGLLQGSKGALSVLSKA